MNLATEDNQLVEDLVFIGEMDGVIFAGAKIAGADASARVEAMLSQIKGARRVPPCYQFEVGDAKGGRSPFKVRTELSKSTRNAASSACRSRSSDAALRWSILAVERA